MNEIQHNGSGQSEIRARACILETTDLHMQIMAYDYFADCPTDFGGLIPLTHHIEAARNANPTGTFLFDNGDFLQGNPMADFVAANLEVGKTHPMVQAMNTLSYDAVCLGNHEFNYGLDYLDAALSDASFEVVCANARRVDNTKFYKPFHIVTRKVQCSDGQHRPLRIGVIGLVTPQVVNWDKSVLGGGDWNV